MSFNIWYGGVSIDFGQIAEAIREADADIVGVQETEANLRRLADAAGLPYADESLHLISRYPLFAVERDGVRFAYAEVERDRVVAVENVHLTCCPYGPNLVKAGKPAEDVLALEERVRLPEARDTRKRSAAWPTTASPCSSPATSTRPRTSTGRRGHRGARPALPARWPASKAFADAGFRDSYREAHPDPAAKPGLTWTAGQPPPRMRPSETNDRIDWVLVAGPAETLSSGVVGEEGGPDVEVGVSPWGSDHRAVVSAFAAEPAPAPYLVSADAAGGRPGRAGDAALHARRRRPRAHGRDRRRRATPRRKPEQTIPIYDASDHIAPMLGTAGLAPGRHAAVLLERDGEVLASAEFWVAAPGAEPAIDTGSPTYRPGEPVDVRWRDAPANKLDYVAIFPADDPSVYGYLGFVYTGARPEGSLEFTRADTGRLAPGRYVARLMLDDGYSALASAPVTVDRAERNPGTFPRAPPCSARRPSGRRRARRSPRPSSGPAV